LLVIPVVAVVLIVAVTVTSHYRWPWAEPFTRRWDQVLPIARAYVRCAPATFTYLFILLITTWVLRSSTLTIDRQLLWQHSTNLIRLRDDPVSVLVTSAFWLTPRELLLWLALFPLVMAPVEKWLGSLRGIVVFFVGHVGASLVTAAIIAVMITHGWAPHRLKDVIDVGSSYGFWCVAALFSYRLPGRWGWAWAGAILAGALGFIVWRTSFSDYGHLVAMVIGLALYPVTRVPAVRLRDGWPIWRPPALMIDLEVERMEARHRLSGR